MLVSVVVKQRVTDATKRGQGKASCHAGNGSILNVEPPQGGVETIIEDRRTGDDTERVEIGNYVVGHAVGLKHGGQEAGCVTDAVVVQVLDREETEDAGGLECAADVVNEIIVPPGDNVAAKASSRNVRGLGKIPKAVAADALDTTTPEDDSKDAEDIGEIAPTGRVEDDALVQEPQEERQGEVKDEGNQEREPPLYRPTD